METGQSIRDALGGVARLRQHARENPALGTAVADVKRLQSRRFVGTYQDLLRDSAYAPAARFFLEELYSDQDYSQRDAQFSRIAGAIETLFPRQVAQMAAALARLHALTEDLDHAVAGQWLALPAMPEAMRYTQAWRASGRRHDRELQLAKVLEIGQELVRLTRTPGLRMMLRMMRAAAATAGLSALQHFLEGGFDTFSALARQRGRAEHFMDTIAQRESALLVLLFDADPVACETELAHLLGQAP